MIPENAGAAPKVTQDNKGVGFMDIIGNILGTPLGYIMKFCYDIIHDYGLAIIVFTLLTKFILFPVSLMVQKNSKIGRASCRERV